MLKTTRKLWSAVLCVCLLLTMLCTMPAAAADSVVLGDFNDAVVGLGDWTSEGTVEHTVEEGDRNGYVTLTAASGTDARLQLFNDKVAINPNQLYALTFWYKSSNDNTAHLTLYEYLAGDSSTGTFSLKLPTTDGAWKKCTYYFTSGETAAKMTVILYADGKNYYADGKNVVCVDDVQLTADADGVCSFGENETGYIGFKVATFENDTSVKLSGYMKATEETEVEIGMQMDAVSTLTPMTKKVGTDWQQFGISELTYKKKGPAFRITTGTAPVSLQMVSIAVYDNLLKNASFEATSATNNTAGTVPTNWGFNAIVNGAATIQADSTAPDGKNSIIFKRENMDTEQEMYRRFYVYAVFGTHGIDAVAGDRYLLSLWYKANTAVQARIIQKTAKNAATGDEELTVGTMTVNLPSTGDTWKRTELAFQIMDAKDFITDADSTDAVVPTMGRVDIQLGHFESTNIAENEYIGFDCVELKKMEADYADFKIYKKDGAVQKIVESDAATVASEPYLNLLGEPSELAAGTGTVAATYLTGGSTSSTNMVVMAAYKKGDNNEKNLVSVDISAAESTTKKVNYPTAEFDMSAVSDYDEIRAFLWDGISGLKPLEAAIAITK